MNKMSTLTKLDVQKRVLKDGNLLDLDLFEWNEKTRTFKSNIGSLVLDFSGINNCSFDTYSDCNFETGDNCSFDTCYNCDFNTGSDCSFDTLSSCKFKTGSNCSFDTNSNCKFEIGDNCIVNRRDTYETIYLKPNIETISCPYNIEGYLEKINDKYTYSKDEENEYIIVDNILSRVISRKGNVLKVQNYNETKESYIVKDGDLYSHGETINEARESLVYKISSRDTSMYKDLTLDSILSKDECIRMYRVITGACESGTKYFVSKQEPSKIKDSYSIIELIEVTKGQFGNDKLVQFMEN